MSEIQRRYVVELDKNVPLIKKVHSGRPSKYPWREMKVGDSFLFPKGLSVSAAYAATRYAKNGMGIKVTIRQTDEGLRVWRIK